MIDELILVIEGGYIATVFAVVYKRLLEKSKRKREQIKKKFFAALDVST